MKLIYHAKELTFKNLFKKHELDPSDETTLFLLPGVSVVQEIEDCYSGGGVWGKNLLTFNEFSDFVNEASPNLKKKRISRTQALSVTRKAAESVSGGLEVFREFSQNRDFLNAVASIVSKLKQSKVSVGEFVGSARRVNARSLRKKLSDIGLVYEKYEALITERGFLDDADSVRVISEELEREGLAPFFPSAKKLVIFGFSDFTLCELDVIKSLSSAVSETFFFVSDFGGLDEYRDRFLGRLREASMPCEEDFAMTDEVPEAKTQSKFGEFRDSHDEIEYVSRTIKKLIVDEEYKASDFKVLVRSSQRRSRSIVHIFEKNGVAVDLRNSGTLAGSVYGRLAGDILRLKSGNFHRNDLIGLLFNPLFSLYLGESDFSQRCTNLVKEISSASVSSEDRKYRTVSGISGWKRILEHIVEKDAQLSAVARDIGSVLGSVSSKFGRRTFAAMTSDLRKIFSELEVSESSALLIERNQTTRECFDEFFSFLRELSFSYEDFDFRVSDPVEYLLFLDEFMGERTVPYKTPCDGDSERVSVTDFSAARGISPKFLFLVGLSDTCFPSPLPADPVLKPREKAEMNRVLKKRVFDEEGLHYEKEKHLFSTLATATSEKVFLSCFRYDQKSREIIRSDFLEEKGISPPARRSESFSEPGEIFSGEDALFHCFSPSGISDVDPKLAEIIREHYGSDVVGYLSGGISAERKRLDLEGDYTDFEGVLRNAPSRLDTFSPTKLETYGTCPFMYFSKEMLKLGMVRDPEEQRASQLDLGSLAHEILREFMETVFAEGSGWPEASRVAEIYEKLKRKYETKPGVFSHLPKNVAEIGKKRFFDCILPNFITDEIQRIGKDEFIPRVFEKEVKFRIGNAEIRGKVDRVDVHRGDEKKAAVIDYKIGGVKGRKYFDFENLQLPLYLKALLEEGAVPSRGSYLSIGKPGESASSKDPYLDEAASLAEHYVENIRKGFFPPYVGRKEENQEVHYLEMSKNRPCSYCDYADLCRVKNGVVRRTGRSQG
ncbi:MAG: PD-(D/E)XK nuclease family protein [Candidatus Dadabacteria bacterium]|nr:PD-(D/E)XK nuclease family protein [Candidatus Dadabacteria bacterium]